MREQAVTKLIMLTMISTVLVGAGFGCASTPYLPSGKQTSVVSQTEGFMVKEAKSAPITHRTEIRPGYQIQLNSSVDQKLNGQYRVTIDGELRLPYGLVIQAQGLSVQALNDKVNVELSKFYKSSPQVTSRISEKKYFIEVRGLVQKPGLVLVSEFEKIEDVIKKSGDLNAAKAVRLIQIVRGQNTYYIDLEEYFQGRDMNLNPKWFGGEKVYFLQAATALGQESTASVYILGDLRNPGAMAFKDGANIYHYVAKAGGTTQTSDLDRVQVVRQTVDGPVVTEGTAEEIAQNIKLEVGDMVFMGSGLPSRNERRVQLSGVIASILSAIGVLIIAL